MIQHETILKSTLIKLVTLVFACTLASANEEQDTSGPLTDFNIYGGLHYGVGLTDKEHTDIWSGRVGVLFTVFGVPNLRLQIGVDALHVRKRNWIASTNTQIGWSPYLFEDDRFALQWHATLGGGQADLPEEQLIQILSGIEARYDFRADERLHSNLPSYVFVVMGYGRDFCQNQNQEFLNVGISFGEWFRASFDIASLWRDASPIINASRLR